MILWLGESSGAPKVRVRRAADAALSAKSSLAAQAAAIRRVISWAMIEHQLMDKITTTIKREFLQQIAAGEKSVEYCEMKPYWAKRLSGVKTPFVLRLINGMEQKAPEVTVVIDRVRQNARSGYFELHIREVVGLRHWDLKHGRPARD
jgi:hypothetical protein